LGFFVGFVGMNLDAHGVTQTEDWKFYGISFQLAMNVLHQDQGDEFVEGD
jgi:hypothetical protein